jgi:hypothetical protein
MRETITTRNATNLQWYECYPLASAQAAETITNARSAALHMHHISCRQLIVTAIAAIVSSAAYAAEFTIVNASNIPLQHLYISPCGARHWGPDQFTEALPPSRFFTVSSIMPGCYDIQFVVAPWNTCVIAGASLRRSEVWKVTQWTVFGSQSGDCSHVASYVPARRRPWSWQSTSASDMKRE